MNKVWDIKTPAKDLPNMFGMDMGWLNKATKESWLIQHRIACINARYGKRIEVKEAPSDMKPFGTTDGQSYHMNPARDEAINDCTEKH